MTIYQRIHTPERVEAVRLIAPLRDADKCLVGGDGEWVVCGLTHEGRNYSRFMSDEEFRREYEEVKAPTHECCCPAAFQKWWTNPMSGKTFCRTCQAERPSVRTISVDLGIPISVVNGGWWSEKRLECLHDWQTFDHSPGCAWNLLCKICGKRRNRTIVECQNSPSGNHNWETVPCGYGKFMPCCRHCGGRLPAQ